MVNQKNKLEKINSRENAKNKSFGDPVILSVMGIIILSIIAAVTRHESVDINVGIVASIIVALFIGGIEMYRMKP